jgi:transcriptional regulator with XRE-family HTH domain
MNNKRKVKIEHDEIVERFARRLRELRVERGMTQTDLARRARVTATYISKLESAGAAPGIDLVDKLASALGVGVNDLIRSMNDIDPSVVSREQARTLFESLLKKADQQTFAMLNPFLALLIEAAGKRA